MASPARTTATFHVAAALAVALALLALGTHSITLYHSITQIFCAIVSFTVFNLGWNSRSFTRNNLLIVVPAACLVVGALDIVHFLVYEELALADAFRLPTADTAALLGSASRMVLAGSLLTAAFCVSRDSVLSATKALLTSVLILAVIAAGTLLRAFPPAYAEATGTTVFKLFLEAASGALFAASAVLYWRRRNQLDRSVLRSLLLSLVFLAVSCAFFASYRALYSNRVIAGQTLKSIGYGFLYIALVRNSLKLPYDSLFRKLAESERALRLELETRRETEEALRHSEQRFRELFETSCDGIIMMDLGETILDCNEAFASLLGYASSNEIKGQSQYAFVAPDQHTAGRQVLLDEVFAHGYCDEYETQLVDSSGRTVPVSMRAWLRRDRDGNPVGLWTIVRNITERKQSEERIQYLSFHDPLTGLYNRAYFEEEVRRLDTRRQSPLSLIMGDVNGLKIVNDVFGHPEGDKLLVGIARVLQASCRHEDVVARWGGDEFAILLPRTDAAASKAICNRIKDACSKSPSDPIDLSISLGVATRETMEESTSILLREAEDRMYSAKLRESRSIRDSILRSLESLLWNTQHETKDHVRRLEALARRLGEQLKLPQRLVESLSLLARVHDIGKIAVPRSLLNRPGKLTAEEWEMLMKHSEAGYRIAEASPELRQVAQAILSHHERWDGSGYPQGLKGRDIPILARIIAVIDAYDVMTNGRPYQAPVSPEEAIRELRRNAGSQFDPKLVDAFARSLEYFDSGDVRQQTKVQ